MKKNSLVKALAILILMTTALTAFAQNDPSFSKERSTAKDAPTALLLEESFDDPVFPPAGWLNLQLSGSGLWAWTAAGINPPCTPHSGEGMAYYNDYSFGANVSAMLITPPLFLPAGLPKNVKFWMYRDYGWPTYADSLAVYYNTMPGMNGAVFLGKVERYYWMSDWFEFNFPIDPAVSGTYFFIFKANSNWGNDMFLDDIRIEALHANDAGMFSIVSPSAMVIAGDIVPEVTIKNYGTEALTNIPVKYRNGQTGQVFTETVPMLDSAATARVVFPAWNATAGGPYDFIFYTDLPGDENHSNDTLVKQIICTGSNQSYAHSFSGGLYHSLSICKDKTLMAWGRNSDGQLGDGTNTDSNIPVHVSGLTDVIRVAAGKYHSVALKEDGTVWSFGNNGSGQLGNGSTVNSNVPVQVSGLTDITSITAGDDHTLAIRGDSTVWAWGSNSWGQLGDGTTNDSDIPVQVTGISGAAAVAAGESFSMALLGDGTIMAWGANQNGQLGNGTLVNTTIPVLVPDFADAIDIAAGTTHSVALKNDGTVWAWGYNYLGQIGNGTNTDSRVPLQATGIQAITNISAGGASSYAIKYDGTAWAWGWNSNGQLGNGTTVDSNLPVQISGPSNMIAIAGGSFHSLSIDQEGSLFTWGFNSYGQLGNGSNTDSHVPVLILGLCPVYTSAGEQGEVRKPRLFLYPNPTGGPFALQFEAKDGALKEGFAEIFNAFGEKIYASRIEPGKLTRIDLTGKGKGFFIVRVSTEKDVLYGKLIVK